MKAISLWEPWASAIPAGLKNNETRSWKTAHRGPIAIHAARIWGEDQAHFFREIRERLGFAPEIQRGKIVAVAELVACHRTEDAIKWVSEREKMFGDYAPGRWAWELINIRRLPLAVPWRGAQGLFEIPYTVEQLLTVYSWGADFDERVAPGGRP